MPDLLTITDVVADIGIIVAAIACLVFVTSYWGFFNWRLTAEGRSLMYFVVALLSVAVIAFLGRWLGPEYLGREFFRPVTWWAVAITAIRMTYVLWTSSRRGAPLNIQTRSRKDHS